MSKPQEDGPVNSSGMEGSLLFLLLGVFELFSVRSETRTVQANSSPVGDSYPRSERSRSCRRCRFKVTVHRRIWLVLSLLPGETGSKARVGISSVMGASLLSSSPWVTPELLADEMAQDRAGCREDQ